MAAPSTLAVAVDLEEYSRFEADKNTINVTVVPGIPTTDVATASLVGDSVLLVQDTSTFPQSYPFNINIGKGADLESAIVTGGSSTEFTLSSPLAFAHPLCDPVQLIVDLDGELVALQLIKARRNRDVVVATKQVTLTGLANVNTTFFLPDIVDQNAASRVRRGGYFIRATSITDPTVDGNSGDFILSIMTVDRFKLEFLHGVDAQALETESIKDQPALVTGVTIPFVSRGHARGWFPLAYNYSDPGGCGTPVRLLSWCGGPNVAIKEGKTKYTLRKGNSQTEYIDAFIPAISGLPTYSTAEDLLVDREPLKDEFFRSELERAISWIEESALMCFMEPTRVVTEIDQNSITYDTGTDIPTFVLSDWDKRVDALTYNRPSDGHWINFRMPYFPTIQFYTLYGKVSNVRIVDIALEWVEIHERGGFVELVPFNQEVAFNFIGLIWVESIRGPIPIPNFWNFDALVGYRETPQIMIELMAKKAAVEALAIIGQAFRPGIGSQSVSRDGVSESVSYLTAGIYGIFSATIKNYREWIEANLPGLRGAFKGVNMLVV